MRFNHDHMEALFEGLSQRWQRERAATQLTLGQLIAALEVFPAEQPVANLHGAHSYRGYYCDLAFTLGEGTRPAGELLHACRECMGRAFQGYKGGRYVMGELTPVFVAEYGCTGERLMGLTADGRAQTAPDNFLDMRRTP